MLLTLLRIAALITDQLLTNEVQYPHRKDRA